MCRFPCAACFLFLVAILFFGCAQPFPPRGPGQQWANSFGMRFVCVPAGEFRMGSTDEEVEAVLERFAGQGVRKAKLLPEQPAHPVRITRPFLMGKYEVTVGQFRRFVEATGYRTDAERHGGSNVYDAEASQEWFKKKDASWRRPGFAQTEHHPVVCVSWNDAQVFLKWLNQVDETKPVGWAYRLATEAEWEYAARHSSHREYAWGNEWKGRRANFADQRSGLQWADDKADDGHARTAPVGSYSPAGDTPLGIADMTGNVWEWCRDTFAADFYKRSPAKDPVCLEPRPERVERGGSWAFTRDYCRAAFRFRLKPTDSYDNLGFRIVLARTP